MLLELAVGDAYGAGFEYAAPEFVKQFNVGVRYQQHPKWINLRPGSYTDDTQMSLALAEHLINGRKWDELSLANSFVEAFSRDPREGYAQGFYSVLTQCQKGSDLLRLLAGHGDSDKSGGAMRAGVVGLYHNVDEVLEKSRIQASITHHSVDGIAAAQASSLMVHYLVHSLGAKEDLGEYICSYVPGNWNLPFEGKVGSNGWMSVRAAITAVVQENTLLDILKRSVAFTGDTDTVAAIALGAASCSNEVEKNIPLTLLDGLENGTYGKDFLTKLDKQLLSYSTIQKENISIEAGDVP